MQISSGHVSYLTPLDVHNRIRCVTDPGGDDRDPDFVSQGVINGCPPDNLGIVTDFFMDTIGRFFHFLKTQIA